MFNFGGLMKHSFCWILSKKGNETASFFEAAIHNAGSLNRGKKCKRNQNIHQPLRKEILNCKSICCCRGEILLICRVDTMDGCCVESAHRREGDLIRIGAEGALVTRPSTSSMNWNEHEKLERKAKPHNGESVRDNIWLSERTWVSIYFDLLAYLAKIELL